MPIKRPMQVTIFASVFVLVLTVDSSAAAVVGPSTAVVSQTGTRLVDALQDQSVNYVVISSNYSVGTDFNTYVFPHEPLSINRNVTISGSNGTDIVLDLQFLQPAIQLCSTCVLTIANITLYRERRGSGGELDWLNGQPGSKLVVLNSFKLRLACSSADDAAPVLEQLPRSKLGPAPGMKQQFAVGEVVFEGVHYSDQLQLIDYSVDVPWAVHEGRGPSGGYTQIESNVTRVCLNMVDPRCYATKSAETCVNELIDQIAAGNTAAGRKQGSSVAGIAAGVAVAGVVLLAAILLLIVCVRKRNRQQQQLPPLKHSNTPGLPPASSAGTRSGEGGHDLDVEPGMASFIEGAQAHRFPLATGKGWQLHSMLTTPLMSASDKDRIEFGELLGAGSFGRVYHGTWGGREVAIKVIDHDSDALEAVENEVQFMFRFNHPNIVRAQHSTTYTKVPGSGTGSRAQAALGRLPISHAGSSVGNAESSSSQPGVQSSGSCCSVDKATTGSVSITQQQQQQQLQGAAAVVPCSSTSSMGNCGAGPAGSCGTGSATDMAGSRRPVRAETWLVTEFCDLGTLGNVALHLDCEQPEARALQLLLLLKDAAQGLQVLHSEKVVHGDLNARNVLVSSSAVAPNGMTAKIGDFGLSRTVKQHRSHRTTNTIGSLSHMPPELLFHGHMSTAADIYSFAIMAWEIFTGDYAFHKVLYGQLFETVVLRQQRPSIPQHMPPDVVVLLQHCWAQEAAQRPTAATLLQALRIMIHSRQNGSSEVLSKVVDDLKVLLGPLPRRSTTRQILLPQHQQQALDASQVRQLNQTPALPHPQEAVVHHDLDGLPVGCTHDQQACERDSMPSKAASCIKTTQHSLPDELVVHRAADTGIAGVATNAGCDACSSAAAATSGVSVKLPSLDSPSTPEGAVHVQSSFRYNSGLSQPADQDQDLQLDSSVREGQQHWFV